MSHQDTLYYTWAERCQLFRRLKAIYPTKLSQKRFAAHTRGWSGDRLLALHALCIKKESER